MYRVESLVLDSLTADPSTPEDGRVWYNSTDGMARVRQGGATMRMANATIGRTIVVAKGSDITTVAAGIAAASALVPTPSSTNPAMILLYPGTYTEVPFTIPSFVALIGLGGEDATKIAASTATAALATLSDSSIIRGIVLSGANGVGGIGIFHNTGVHAHIEECEVRDCTTEVQVTGAGAKLTIRATTLERASGEVGTSALQVLAGAEAECHLVDIRGASGVRITTGLEVQGANSKARVTGLLTSECTTGLYVHSGGAISGRSAEILDCGVGLRVSDGTLLMMGVTIQDSDTDDLLIDDNTAVVRIASGIIRHDKTDMSSAPNADVVTSHVSETPGDVSYHVIGELQVGTELQGKESSFGGGDSHTRQMVVMTNTNGEIGTWNDITSSVNLDDGSSANLFAGVAANNAVYIGSPIQFKGTKARISTAMVLGSGAVTLEYWNGTAWVSNTHMSTDAEFPYNQYAQTLWERAGYDHIRFGDFTAQAVKTLNGFTSHYWLRVIINTAITTVPAADFIKLHTNRTEINADGVLEFFGTPEPRQELLFHPNLSDSLDGAVPASSDTALTANITINTTNNSLVGSALDGRGGRLLIPPGLDTSKPLEFTIGWKPSTAGTGDIEFEKRHGVVNEGDLVNGTISDILQSTIISVSGQQDELIFTTFSFTIPDALPGAVLAMSYFRDGTAGNADDTFTGAADIVLTRFTGVFWR